MTFCHTEGSLTLAARLKPSYRTESDHCPHDDFETRRHCGCQIPILSHQDDIMHVDQPILPLHKQ